MWLILLDMLSVQLITPNAPQKFGGCVYNTTLKEHQTTIIEEEKL
jgi:hypothetical protein